MNGGYGDYHDAEGYGLSRLFDLFYDDPEIDALRSEVNHAHNRATDCRRRGDEHAAQAWDAKALEAGRRLAAILPQGRGG